jgi:hypothetical protein
MYTRPQRTAELRTSVPGNLNRVFFRDWGCPIRPVAPAQGGLSARTHRRPALGLIATRAVRWFLAIYSASTPPIPPVEPELSLRSVSLVRTITSWPRPSACPATQQMDQCRSRESCVPRLECAVVESAAPHGCRLHPAQESCDFFRRQSWRPV